MCPRQIAKILDHKSYPIFSIREIRKWPKTINRDRKKNLSQIHDNLNPKKPDRRGIAKDMLIITDDFTFHWNLISDENFDDQNDLK